MRKKLGEVVCVGDVAAIMWLKAGGVRRGSQAGTDDEVGVAQQACDRGNARRSTLRIQCVLFATSKVVRSLFAKSKRISAQTEYEEMETITFVPLHISACARCRRGDEVMP